MLNEIWKKYIKKTQKNENDDDIYILYNIYLYISGVVSGGYARIIIISDICCIVTLILHMWVCMCVKKIEVEIEHWTIFFWFCDQHQKIYIF